MKPGFYPKKPKQRYDLKLPLTGRVHAHLSETEVRMIATFLGDSAFQSLLHLSRTTNLTTIFSRHILRLKSIVWLWLRLRAPRVSTRGQVWPISREPDITLRRLPSIFRFRCQWSAHFNASCHSHRGRRKGNIQARSHPDYALPYLWWNSVKQYFRWEYLCAPQNDINHDTY